MPKKKKSLKKKLLSDHTVHSKAETKWIKCLIGYFSECFTEIPQKGIMIKWVWEIQYSSINLTGSDQSKNPTDYV